MALTNFVNSDHQTSTRYKLKQPMTWEYYGGLTRLGNELEVFEDIFKDINAPKHPLTVITPIVCGEVRFELSMKLGPIRRKDLNGTQFEQPGEMIDYLDAYMTEEGFDIPRLLDDDYFKAIKLLFNEGYYVSCAKLLMSFIDTLAFIDTGNDRGDFTPWLDAYAELEPLGITAKELWEFRNGLLHMSNLRSRAVKSGKTAPLILSVGRSIEPLPAYLNGEKRFNFKDLIDAIAYAVANWIGTLNQNPDRFPDFISRYDLTVSDSRVARISIDVPSTQSK